eukprot:CAMPEP_0178412390 /NCGR_PEP_ID=MMETSP0689_2-20121128/21992_1 /TAXON_ID=160604 /ORGANISM="Amphidinium massartii, Strain CS-259" /LENGTH=403 /DNA_ID=CAMNT_0020033639 /DNA_START=143 /DNA_END=1351 /DNA_ORIENTATION=+
MKEAQDEAYNLVYSLANSASLVTMFLAGLMFDSMGPKLCSVLGSLAAAAGLLLSAVAVQHPSLNNLLYFSYPLAAAGGYGASYSAYGYIWCFGSHHQNLVAGFASATAAVSDALIILGVFLDSESSITFPKFLAILAGTSATVSIGLWYLVPGRIAYLASVQYALEKAGEEELQACTSKHDSREGLLDVEDSANGSKEGIEGPSHHDAEGLDELQEDAERSCWEDIVDSYRAFKLHTTINMLFWIYLLLVWCFLINSSSNQFSLYKAMKLDAKALVDAYAVIYGVAGAIMFTTAGFITDALGLQRFFLLQLLLVIVYAVSLVVPSFHVQLAAQLIQIFLISSYTAVCIRWTIVFVPARLLGTFSGLQFALVGLLQVGLLELATRVALAIFSDGVSANFFISQS